jgi:superfamily II DNA/RNA helicase
LSPKFADLGVPAPIVAALAADDRHHPFAIQTAVLPDALAGRDICGKAPTGSGKTLAFAIPVAARSGRAKPRRPRTLILTPTRELAAQVRRELAPLAKAMGLSTTVVYGGVGFEPQRKALRNGADILVACPGRLEDLINRRDVTLDDVDLVVIDEADHMADLGFLPPVKRLLNQVRPDRQTMLFSATLDGEIDVLVRSYQSNPARHSYEPVVKAAPARHLFWSTDGDDRVKRCAEIVKACGPTVVFSRTKHGADRIAKQMARHGVNAAAIHGDRSQGQRDRALRDFATGRTEALIATDVAARGIHVDGVACVIHADPPADSKAYMHRSGRTARAGNGGVVVTLANSEQGPQVAALQRALGLALGLTRPDPAKLVPPAPGEVLPTPALIPGGPTGAYKAPKKRSGGNGGGGGGRSYSGAARSASGRTHTGSGGRPSAAPAARRSGRPSAAPAGSRRGRG